MTDYDYKLVPFPPTPEMVEAAADAYMPFGDMELAIRMAILAAPAMQGEPSRKELYKEFSEWCQSNPGFDLDCRLHTHGGPIDHGGYISNKKTRVAFAAYCAGRLSAPKPAEQQPSLMDGATYRCRKCGEQNEIMLNSARIVTRLRDGSPRDPRDIESDPAGTLIHDPAKPLSAAPAAPAMNKEQNMNTEQERAEFEAWANTQADKWLMVGGLTWSPGTNDYASARTNAAWAAWQAGRSALQSQDQEDASQSEPSDMDIDDLSREWGQQSAAYPSKMMVRDFARALLSRYGRHAGDAQPVAYISQEDFEFIRSDDMSEQYGTRQAPVFSRKDYRVSIPLYASPQPPAQDVSALVEALEAEIERLREDAARYRLLRKGAVDDVAVVRGLGAMDYGMSAVVATYSEEIDGDDLDAAIDQARGEGEP